MVMTTTAGIVVVDPNVAARMMATGAAATRSRPFPGFGGY